MLQPLFRGEAYCFAAMAALPEGGLGAPEPGLLRAQGWRTSAGGGVGGGFAPQKMSVLVQGYVEVGRTL